MAIIKENPIERFNESYKAVKQDMDRYLTLDSLKNAFNEDLAFIRDVIELMDSGVNLMVRMADEIYGIGNRLDGFESYLRDHKE